MIVIFGCKTKINKPINAPQCLIFEYMGETNKPIPVIIFCDSLKYYFHSVYYNKFLIDSNTLYDLSKCIPVHLDTSKYLNYPLYKITSKYAEHQNIVYIFSPKVLNLLLDCVEKRIEQYHWYSAYIEMESARAMNPD